MQPATAPAPAAALALATVPDSSRVLRVGLEFLPPDERFATVDPSRPEVRSLRPQGEPRSSQRERGGGERKTTAPLLARTDFAAIDDPIARETMHFLADLVDTDRQRVRREVGIPFFDYRREDADHLVLLHSEERNLADQEQWIQQNGMGLLRRPMRNMLKRLPVVHDLQLEVEEFRSDHLPLSQAYQDVHGDRRKLGRLSVRLRASDLGDPLEIVYIHSGVRIGTSQRHAKLSIDIPIDARLHLSFRARNDYDSGEVNLRADLIYSPTARFNVHLAAGDDMDFLSTSSIYSLYQSPMDGKAGLVLYAVHTF